MRDLKDLIQIRCPLDLEGWRHDIQIRKTMGHYHVRWLCPVFGEVWFLAQNLKWIKSDGGRATLNSILYVKDESELQRILFGVRMPPTYLGLK